MPYSGGVKVTKRFSPFVCVILATIRTNTTVASKIDGEVGVAMFAVICEKTTIFVFARQHFIYLVTSTSRIVSLLAS